MIPKDSCSFCIHRAGKYRTDVSVKKGDYWGTVSEVHCSKHGDVFVHRWKDCADYIKKSKNKYDNIMIYTGNEYQEYINFVDRYWI